MKSEQIYQQLKELAEKLDITVSEQNLGITPGIKVQSGLCKVKGKQIFIMDKHKGIPEKVELLATCLSGIPLEAIYIMPAVREILDKYRDR